METKLPSTFTIEPLRPDDFLEATEMRLQSWRDTYVNEDTGITSGWLEGVIANDLSEEVIAPRRQRLETSKGKGWVARDGRGKIIGVSLPYVMDDGTQRAGGLYVDKAWHGKGVGGQLLQKALGSHDPSKPVLLSVATYTERARAFYRKYGFEELPGALEYFHDKIPMVKMIRKGGE